MNCFLSKINNSLGDLWKVNKIKRKENRIRKEDVGQGESNNNHHSGEVTEDGVIVCGIWTGMEQVGFVKLCYPLVHLMLSLLISLIAL